MQKYLVFSADWEIELPAKDFLDAALVATELMYEQKGELFNVSKIVAVVNQKKQIESFDTVAIFEDLHMYRLARGLKQFLKNVK